MKHPWDATQLISIEFDINMFDMNMTLTKNVKDNLQILGNYFLYFWVLNEV